MRSNFKVSIFLCGREAKKFFLQESECCLKLCVSAQHKKPNRPTKTYKNSIYLPCADFNGKEIYVYDSIGIYVEPKADGKNGMKALCKRR